MIILAQGYWRQNNHTDEIVSCSNFPQNCLGGADNFTCFEGHMGAFCETCDINSHYWSEKYSFAGKGVCGKCSQADSNNFKVIGLMCWTLVSMLISVKGTIQHTILIS